MNTRLRPVTAEPCCSPQRSADLRLDRQCGATRTRRRSRSAARALPGRQARSPQSVPRARAARCSCAPRREMRRAPGVRREEERHGKEAQRGVVGLEEKPKRLPPLLRPSATHHSWRAGESAAGMPGSSGARPTAGASPVATKPAAAHAMARRSSMPSPATQHARQKDQRETDGRRDRRRAGIEACAQDRRRATMLPPPLRRLVNGSSPSCTRMTRASPISR